MRVELEIKKYVFSFVCACVCACVRGAGSGFEMQILTEDCYERRQTFSAATQQSVFVCSVFDNNMFSSGPVYPFNITKTSQKPKGHFQFSSHPKSSTLT